MPTTPALTTHEEVMFFDTDAGGVVHNIAYLRYIETCRTRLAVLLGMDLRAMMAEHVFAVVVRTEIDYLRPALPGDRLVIHGELTGLRGARFHCAFRITRGDEDKPLITCRQTLSLVQMPACRVLRLPPSWKAQWPHLAAARD